MKKDSNLKDIFKEILDLIESRPRLYFLILLLLVTTYLLCNKTIFPIAQKDYTNLLSIVIQISATFFGIIIAVAVFFLGFMQNAKREFKKSLSDWENSIFVKTRLIAILGFVKNHQS